MLQWSAESRSTLSNLLPLLVVVVMASACEERPAPSTLPWSVDATLDVLDAALDVPEDIPEPSPVPTPADVCDRGAVRCVAQATGTIEECRVPAGSGDLVTRWVSSQCPAGQVCHDGGCGALACEPGRMACRDLEHRGTCAGDGRSVEDVSACPSPTLCRGGVCVDLCESARASKSYIGCEYMLVELPNQLMVEGTPEAPFGVVVANESDIYEAQVTITSASGSPEPVVESALIASTAVETTPVTVHSEIRNDRGVVISNPAGPAADLVIPAGGTAVVLLNRAMVPSRSGTYPLGRRLVSSRPVVAYQFNPFCCNFSFSNDASLLLPVSGLGTDYTFNGAPDWVEQGDLSSSPTGLTLVAHTETEVEIHRGPHTTLDGEASDADIFSLSAGDVLHLQSAADGQSRLSGTSVHATETVSVFSTHLCTFIPHDLAACDHLEQQLIPDDTWGLHYLLGPTVARDVFETEVTYWRIGAGSLGAEVRLGASLDTLAALGPFGPRVTDCRDVSSGAGGVLLTLEPGADCMFGSRQAVSVEATAPISVVGFVAGEEAAGGGAGRHATGDPSMFLLPPSEQYRNSYVFLSPSTYTHNYMTLLLSSVAAASALTFDGLPLNAHAEGNLFEVVEGSKLVLHVPIEPGVHRISASNPFGVLVYAYDRYVSFAYTGGLNLAKRR